MADLVFGKQRSIQESDGAHPCVHHSAVIRLFSKPELSSNKTQMSQPGHAQAARKAGPGLHPPVSGTSPTLQPSTQGQEERAILLPTLGHLRLNPLRLEYMWTAK